MGMATTYHINVMWQHTDGPGYVFI